MWASFWSLFLAPEAARAGGGELTGAVVAVPAIASAGVRIAPVAPSVATPAAG
jgi:hypothetical protein